MINFKTLALASAAAILTACATATPYQAAVKTGASGYTSTQIENNRFNVSFSGNSLTNQETVETYLLYRAAELAVQNGYDYFTVADKNTDKKTRVVSTPSAYYGGFGRPFYSGFHCDYDFYHPRRGWRSNFRTAGLRSRSRRGFYSGFGNPFYDPFFDDFNYREITKFKANAQVVMGRGAKPSADNAFNAREVLDNLGSKIIYPEADA